MNEFNIQPVSQFQGTSVAIRRPKEIACFSYDDEHQYHPDGRSMRYYYPPTIGANLCDGFEAFKQLDDSADDHLESLLKTLITFERDSGVKCETDIITWRGMMTKIMATPYDNMGGNGFEMNATFFQGTIFIEENHDYKLKQKASQHSQPTRPGAHSQDMMSFWGYKFETLSLIPNTWDRATPENLDGATPREYIEGREKEVVNNHAQYCSIVKTAIGGAKLILGGEVDAIWDTKPLDAESPINWVELKTSATIESDRDMLKYERKLMKFWIQSFLLGVPKIIVGFRSKAGILERLEDLETKSLPGLVKKMGKGTWDGNVCINFAARFLEWLKTIITTEGLWRIQRRDRSNIIEVFRVEPTGHGKVLSAEFLDWRNRPESGTDPSGGK